MAGEMSWEKRFEILSQINRASHFEWRRAALRAVQSFLKAIGRNEKHDIPYYYLGLINYARRDYTLAEYYYLTSQQMGGELGLTYYALGVNAYADNRFGVAKDYLKKASDADPFGYGEKTTAWLSKMDS